MINGGKNSKAGMKTKDELAQEIYRKVYNNLCSYRRKIIDMLYKLQIMENEL